jgi:hypothetical protein
LFKIYDYQTKKLTTYDSEQELVRSLNNIDERINRSKHKDHNDKPSVSLLAPAREQMNIIFLVSYGVPNDEQTYVLTYIVDPTELTPNEPYIEELKDNHKIVLNKDEFINLILSSEESTHRLACSYSSLRDEIIRNIYLRDGSVKDATLLGIKHQQRKKQAVERYRSEYMTMAKFINDVIHESDSVADFQRKFISKITQENGIGIDDNDLAIFTMVITSYLQYQTTIVPEDLFAIVKAYFAKFKINRGVVMDEDEDENDLGVI